MFNRVYQPKALQHYMYFIIHPGFMILIVESYVEAQSMFINADQFKCTDDRIQVL